MAISIKTKKKTSANPQTLEAILEELKGIKKQLNKLLLMMPEESLEGYKNTASIKKALRDAVKKYMPR